MHRIVDSDGGIYLDAKALAGAGFRPGRRVEVRFLSGQILLFQDIDVAPRVETPTDWAEVIA